MLANFQRNYATADKWALMVGINDYIHPNIRDLSGCETDIELVKAVLTEKYDFPEANIKQLKSRQATKQNIVSAFRTWLIGKPTPDDVVLFYFSGHGVQLKDFNGDDNDGYTC